MACILSLAMICCTCISAKALESDEPSVPIDSSKFIIMSEGESNYVGVSVSYIEHNFSATRLDDGRVNLKINETFHSVRGYYEHLATDSTGKYFCQIEIHLSILMNYLLIVMKQILEQIQFLMMDTYI